MTKINHPCDPLAFPPEITVQIFRHAFQRIPGNVRWRRKSNPLTIGQVCISWRKFIWSCAELWSTLIIRTARQTDVGLNLILLKEWLVRSKLSELDVYIEERDGYARLPIEFYAILLGDSTRLRTLSLHGPSQRSIQSLRMVLESYTAVPQCLSRLSSFIYIDPSVIYYAGSHLDRSSKICLPCVNNLTLEGYYMSGLIRAFKGIISFDQISNLSLLSHSGFHLQYLMDSFFNLREIHFNEVRVQYNPDMVDTVVVHHELRILCVTSLREYSLGTLFCSLSTPGLQTLDVKVQENSPELFTEILTPFLQQSHCHLTELFLTITLESEDEQQLIHFLDVIPTLQKLHIKDPFWTTAGLGASFFDVLRLPSDNTTAFRLPVLEIFTYEGKLSTGCLESMMKSMLSRTKAFTIPSGSVTMKTFTVKSNLYEPTYNEYLTTDSGLPLGLMTEALDGWMDKQVLDDVVKCTQARTFKFMDRKGVVWVLSN